MDRIIHKGVRLNCNRQRAFEMFILNENIETWLAETSDIEPHVGGKYELFWDASNRAINSTINCKITAIERNVLLCFEWKGPVQFAHFMNSAEPLTHVTIFFSQVNANITDVHLIHTGWRSDENWEEARGWFEEVWTRALQNLEKQVNKLDDN